MKYLLDTHIWLWSYLQPSRLSNRIAKAIADPQNELWLSPVSVWELTILCRKGRLRVHPDIAAWVRNTISDLGLTEAPLTIEVALALESLHFSHGDPAGQLLAATAKLFDLTLVTADEHLKRVPGLRVLANR